MSERSWNLPGSVQGVKTGEVPGAAVVDVVFTFVPTVVDVGISVVDVVFSIGIFVVVDVMASDADTVVDVGVSFVDVVLILVGFDVVSAGFVADVVNFVVATIVDVGIFELAVMFAVVAVIVFVGDNVVGLITIGGVDTSVIDVVFTVWACEVVDVIASVPNVVVVVEISFVDVVLIFVGFDVVSAGFVADVVNFVVATIVDVGIFEVAVMFAVVAVIVFVEDNVVGLITTGGVDTSVIDVVFTVGAFGVVDVIASVPNVVVDVGISFEDVKFAVNEVLGCCVLVK